MLDYRIGFDPEKNEALKQSRGICFEDIMPILEDGDWLDVIPNPNQEKYPGQSMFVIGLSGECYIVPHVVDEREKSIFLKTIYPSRFYRKIYFKR